MDSYAQLLQMVAQGVSDAVIAATVNWPLDAVTTLREELQCSTQENQHLAYFPFHDQLGAC